jgi:hypothetical protein
VCPFVNCAAGFECDLNNKRCIVPKALFPGALLSENCRIGFEAPGAVCGGEENQQGCAIR